MMVMTLYPLAAPINESPTPVFPLVASMIVSPGFSEPSFSAVSMMFKAIRSFTDPPALNDSTFTYTSAESSETKRRSFTRGVFPINSVIVSTDLTINDPSIKLDWATLRVACYHCNWDW